MVELSIVVPVYNEENAISPVLDQLTDFKRRFEDRFWPNEKIVEIILVDDGSTDETPAILAASAHSMIVLRQENRGYGAALKYGFRVARGRWVGFLDADGTYPPEEFFSLYSMTDGSEPDLVIGSRLERVSGMPAVRSLGNRTFSWLLGLTSNSSVTDIASGMRLFRRDRLAEIDILPDGLDFTPAMTTWALHEDWTVKEVPIRYAERIGKSKLRVIEDGCRFAYDILSISWLYNPLRLFGAVGALLQLIALALVAGPARLYVEVRQVPDWLIYRLMTALVLWVVGLQAVVCGILGTLIAKILHRKPLRSLRIERILLSPSVTARLHWITIACIVLALWFNRRGIVTYLSTGEVFEHWSRVLAGVILILTGTQVALFRILVGYLGALEARFSRRP